MFLATRVPGSHLVGPLAAVLVCSQRVAWMRNPVGLLSLHSVPRWCVTQACCLISLCLSFLIHETGTVVSSGC